jgi:hypothetical protein
MLVVDIQAARQRWAGVVKAYSNSSAWKLMDLLVRQPVINSQLVQRDLGVAPVNALRAVNRLVTAEVLKEVSGNHRNQLWEATEILIALDEFAERSGRRG